MKLLAMDEEMLTTKFEKKNKWKTALFHSANE
jgi:hypothetical protein